MNELFGVPVDVLTVMLAALAVVALTIVGLLALRRTILVKLGVRNVGRRPARTAIIVGGLMLGTMIIGAALGFGDIMAGTVRTSVITSLGETDEIVSARSTDVPDIETLGQGAAIRYLRPQQAEQVITAAREAPGVDGVAPAISEPASVQNVTSRNNEPNVRLFATDPQAMDGFGTMTGADGDSGGLQTLGPGEVFVNTEAADDLDASTGDTLALFAAGRRSMVTVQDVVSYDGTGTDGAAVLMPLSQAQRALGVGNRVQQILVSNDGDAMSGADGADQVLAALQPTVDRLGLQVDEVKSDGLELADTQGATYLSLFSTFGTFTIAAGILLIFLVFVMLATERRGEMGTARAIGTQRRHLVQMFVFEGVAYDVLAAVVGAALGLLLALVMVHALAGAMVETGLVTIRYHLSWTSFVIALSLGILLTLAVVLVAAWRVSRLNIVAAIRNLPQPPPHHRRRSRWVVALACLLGGGALVATAYSTKSAASLLIGGTLLITAVAPLLLMTGMGDRAVYTIVGLGTLAWNLLPFRVYGWLVPGLTMGFSVFLLAGLLLVAGATCVVVYNLPSMLRGLMLVFGRSRHGAPVVKVAIAGPMRTRFRTGATLGLFTLVVFTLVTGASTSGSFLAAINDEDTFGGGYDITAQTSPLSPITDMRRSLEHAQGLDPEDIVAVAAQSYVPVEARQGDSGSYAGYVARGLDDSFLHDTTYSFAARAQGYSTDHEVWAALATHPNLAVVDAFSVPRRNNWGSAAVSDFRLRGFYLEDETFEPVTVAIRDTQSGRTAHVKVIGVLADSVPYAMIGISTSVRTLAAFGPAAVTPTVWYLRVRDGVDPVEEAKRLETAFLDHGMQSQAQSETLHDAVSASLTFQYLILGFLGLGLVIGVAALGVISARAVVERRQQIGVLRAIGFQARMVQLSFLVEALFVTLTAVVVGTVLGIWVAFNVIQDSAGQPGWDNLTLRPPWMAMAGILIVVLLSSVVTTWLPSIKASRTYPAEALRYQ